MGVGRPGDRYGRLTLVEPLPVINRSGQRVWSVACDCGNVRQIPLSRARSGATRSCGCLVREMSAARFRTHGQSHKTATYRIWKHIRERCSNPRCRQWPYYGGRGVAVCGRWGRYENFLADMGEVPPGETIERIDNDGDYEPDNCRWASRKDQARNRRSNSRITLDGVTLCLAAWADRIGMPQKVIGERIRSGWTAERALTEPVGDFHARRAAASGR